MSPRILIDCDGVLADFVGHLFRRIGSKKSVADVTEWNFFETLEPELHEDARDEMNDPKFWESQPVLPGAIEGCQMIKAKGHEIVCVTSPSNMFGWSNVRETWVRNHFKNLITATICTEHKYMVRGMCLLDDKIQNIRKWEEHNQPFGRAVLFEQPWNSLDEHDCRASGWAEILRRGFV